MIIEYLSAQARAGCKALEGSVASIAFIGLKALQGLEGLVGLLWNVSDSGPLEFRVLLVVLVSWMGGEHCKAQMALGLCGG